MILYDIDKNKHRAIKTNKPRFNSNRNGWDNLIKTIDDTEIKFYFTVKTNRSWFYFRYVEQWYKINMVSDDGIDLYSNNEKLFTKS